MDRSSKSCEDKSLKCRLRPNVTLEERRLGPDKSKHETSGEKKMVTEEKKARKVKKTKLKNFKSHNKLVNKWKKPNGMNITTTKLKLDLLQVTLNLWDSSSNRPSPVAQW